MVETISRYLYRLGLWTYALGVKLRALQGHQKAKQWLAGRRDWQARLQAALSPMAERTGPTYWMHVASLGEFEQGRPVLEALRQEQPKAYIVLTFFSPSGYEPLRHYPGADVVAYLPVDTPTNARRFLGLVQPDVALFVRYEFWYYYLRELHRRGVRTLLIAAGFRSSQAFFKWYGHLFRKMLSYFSDILVQTPRDAALLSTIGVPAQVGGDTRIDRVLALTREEWSDAVIAAFTEQHRIWVAGSTWPPDERRLLAYHRTMPSDYKLLIAPHELSDRHIRSLLHQYGQIAGRYTHLTPEEARSKRVLILDRMGLLSRVYRYGDMAYVGGGFGKGIHSILEPAAYGLPVVFGPNYDKFNEARELVDRAGAIALHPADALQLCLSYWAVDEARKAVQAYIQEQSGSVEKVMTVLRNGNVAQPPQ